MSIDFDHFTPWSALGGGALIGSAAALLIVLDGRIAGISGILAGALRLRRGDTAWRVLFLAGLLLAGVLLPVLGLPLPGPPTTDVRNSATAAAGSLAHAAHLAWILGAGVLVGVGTRAGGGCTSGHGVCGLARGSLRSLVATCTFIAAGVASVYVLRHVG